MPSGAAPTGFIGWITQYGQIIAFFAQLLYWIVIAAVAVWATLLFKRYVDGVAGGSSSAKPTPEAVKVEEFTD